MSDQNTTQRSFIDLIDIFKIQIPILQRDYVQGRNTDEVTDIRENFVSDLVGHLSTVTEKILPLDFIYGYADEEFGKYDREVSKKNIESLLQTISDFSIQESFNISYTVNDFNNRQKNLFVPLDGQQRLTTLFLLHFYVALKYNPEKLSDLKERLTYKTRKSSDQFCEKLLINSKNLNQSLPIAQAIEDGKWFLISWKKDPTVEGMLRMLQQIENQFKTYPNLEERLQIAFENLFINPKVQFDFLDMTEHGLSDDIYLKMNSTGKALSDYDNFKAWFSPKVDAILVNSSVNDKECFKDWSKKLDQDWYNIFWLSDPIHADELIYGFIRSVLSFSLIVSDGEDKLLKEKYDKLNSSSFLPLKFYEDSGLITVENITILFCVLDELCKEGSWILRNISEVWMSTFSGQKEFTREILRQRNSDSLLDETFFYAVLLMITHKSNLPDIKFRKWIRVFRNIIYNSRIDDFSKFIKPVQTLNTFISPNSELQIEHEKWIGTFDGKQIKEEFEKLAFESENKVLEIEALENHHYLFGQINFLFKWATDANGILNWELFRHYRDRLLNLFSTDHLSDKNFIIQRSLLCFNDTWMPPKNSNRYSFCKNTYGNARERDENWRYVFNKENSEILNIIKLSDCQTADLLNIMESKKDTVKDWRRFVIDDPTLISKCGQRMINWTPKGKFVRLLDKTKLSGYHTELRTWVLFKELCEKFNLSANNISYQYVDSGERDCRIRFVAEDCYLKFDKYSNSFCFEKKINDPDNYEAIPIPRINSNWLSHINNFDLKI